MGMTPRTLLAVMLTTMTLPGLAADDCRPSFGPDPRLALGKADFHITTYVGVPSASHGTNPTTNETNLSYHKSLATMTVFDAQSGTFTTRNQADGLYGAYDPVMKAVDWRAANRPIYGVFNPAIGRVEWRKHRYALAGVYNPCTESVEWRLSNKPKTWVWGFFTIKPKPHIEWFTSDKALGITPEAPLEPYFYGASTMAPGF